MGILIPKEQLQQRWLAVGVKVKLEDITKANNKTKGTHLKCGGVTFTTIHNAEAGKVCGGICKSEKLSSSLRQNRDGEKYNEHPYQLTVIDRNYATTRKHFIKCFCGNIFDTVLAKVASGHTKSCGCIGVQSSWEELEVLNELKKAIPDLSKATLKIKGRWVHVDMFSKDRGLVIEYNGITHYKPIYGKKAFDKRVDTDKRKSVLIKNAGLKLITVRYDEYQKDKIKVLNKIIKLKKTHFDLDQLQEIILKDTIITNSINKTKQQYLDYLKNNPGRPPKWLQEKGQYYLSPSSNTFDEKFRKEVLKIWPTKQTINKRSQIEQEKDKKNILDFCKENGHTPSVEHPLYRFFASNKADPSFYEKICKYPSYKAFRVKKDRELILNYCKQHGHRINLKDKDLELVRLSYVCQSLRAFPGNGMYDHEFKLDTDKYPTYKEFHSKSLREGARNKLEKYINENKMLPPVSNPLYSWLARFCNKNSSIFDSGLNKEYRAMGYGLGNIKDRNLKLTSNQESGRK